MSSLWQCFCSNTQSSVTLQWEGMHGLRWVLISVLSLSATLLQVLLATERTLGIRLPLHAALFCPGNFYNKCNTYVIPLFSSWEAASFKSYTGEFFSFTFHDFIITFFGRLCCEDLLHTVINPEGGKLGFCWHSPRNTSYFSSFRNTRCTFPFLLLLWSWGLMALELTWGLPSLVY